MSGAENEESMSSCYYEDEDDLDLQWNKLIEYVQRQKRLRKRDVLEKLKDYKKKQDLNYKGLAFSDNYNRAASVFWRESAWQSFEATMELLESLREEYRQLQCRMLLNYFNFAELRKTLNITRVHMQRMLEKPCFAETTKQRYQELEWMRDSPIHFIRFPLNKDKEQTGWILCPQCNFCYWHGLSTTCMECDAGRGYDPDDEHDGDDQDDQDDENDQNVQDSG